MFLTDSFRGFVFVVSRFLVKDPNFEEREPKRWGLETRKEVTDFETFQCAQNAGTRLFERVVPAFAYCLCRPNGKGVVY